MAGWLGILALLEALEGEDIDAGAGL